ncbi:MAG: DeoR/GlpR family DNA-binding transcription regulator [Kiloniellaceae bacterium]
MLRSSFDHVGAADRGGRARRLDMHGRQRRIVELVRRRGYVSIEAMSEYFAVSSQTIRRDIKRLCARDLLLRYHGGAGLPAGTDKLAYSSRKVRNAAAKREIARLVAREIPNEASLFIDIGTTMEAVAEALLDHEGLRILTNHIGVVSILSQRTDFEINLAGGMVRNRDQAVTGEATTGFLRRFKVGYGIFGIGAIDGEGEMLDYDYRDVQVSLTAMAISRRRFFVADHTKFDGDAMVRLAHVSEIDALFTDAPPPRELAGVLRAHGVRLFVASTAPGSAKTTTRPRAAARPEVRDEA